MMTIIIINFFVHQHKAVGVKTKQSVKQWLQRLLIRCSLCYITLHSSYLEWPKVTNC